MTDADQTGAMSLERLGWRPFFQQQLSLEDCEQAQVARVVRQHRSQLAVWTLEGETAVESLPNMPTMTVGDWLLLDAQGQFLRVLQRASVFERKAAGHEVTTQLIAANVDTVFIVCSLDQDFSLNRIERYLVLAGEARVEPVVILSKADQCPDPETYHDQVQRLGPTLSVLLMNCRDPASREAARPWCGVGQTVAFLGSSGVGKSTLINTLLEDEVQETGAVRLEDSKGRHTTRGRSLHLLASGGLLMDTPGMRELQLGGAEQGLAEAFRDLTDLAQGCRFSDCQHEVEPGCAVRAAVAAGDLDERRLHSYQKLLREQALNAASLAQRRERERKQTRHYRTVQVANRKRKGD